MLISPVSPDTHTLPLGNLTRRLLLPLGNDQVGGVPLGDQQAPAADRLHVPGMLQALHELGDPEPGRGAFGSFQRRRPVVVGHGRSRGEQQSEEQAGDQGAHGATVTRSDGGHPPAEPAMLTIHGTPNLSTSIPKLSPQGAVSSGTVTEPPAESASQ